MSALRWEKQRNPEAWLGYSGNTIIAQVVLRQDGVVVWQIVGVFMRHIGKGNGETSRPDLARAAAGRAWRTWLARAALTAAP